jgi:hypothetical protein
MLMAFSYKILYVVTEFEDTNFLIHVWNLVLLQITLVLCDNCSEQCTVQYCRIGEVS